MMLPRPKVGKACTQAYDDGAFAVCTAMCEGGPAPRKESLVGGSRRPGTPGISGFSYAPPGVVRPPGDDEI